MITSLLEIAVSKNKNEAAPISWRYSRPNLIRSHAQRLPGRRPSSAVHHFGKLTKNPTAEKRVGAWRLCADSRELWRKEEKEVQVFVVRASRRAARRNSQSSKLALKGPSTSGGGGKKEGKGKRKNS